MSSTKSQADDSISRIAFWPFYIAGRFLLAIAFLSMFAVIIGVFAYRSGYQVSLDSIRQPVTPAYMVELNRRSLEHCANSWLSSKAADAAYTVYFKWTGVHSIVLSHEDGKFFGRVVQRYPNETAVAMLASRLFGIRTGNVILSLPLILLVLALATTDGLAERAIRRECGGHESGTRFRIAKRFAYTLLPPVIGLIYLCLPVDMSLGTVMLPALVVTVILVRTKMKYYKKYL